MDFSKPTNTYTQVPYFVSKKYNFCTGKGEDRNALN